MSVVPLHTLESSPAGERLLLAEGIRFAWPGGPPLLSLNWLDLNAGKRLFIEGPSGCGKSTLLSILAGVLRPDAGHVDLLGHDLATASARRADQLRADHIGLIFQQFNLIPYLNAVDNVLLATRFSRCRSKRCGEPRTEAVRLLQHMGIDELHRPVNRQSVGQQQRIACARALIGRPEVVIADEPTSALDPPMRQRFIDLLFDECAAAGSALLFVSHDYRLGDHFDRRLLLERP
ncbi:MAG: ATP-binding cassette domain-containing protein [Gammaproteobacteria bacterium]|nr:ATP-binding cassette domain-containing protein [Gammaproteobacteria bacterium]